jgi:hypothetical protein
VDFNKLYFDHQLLLMKAQQAPSSGPRCGFRIEASAVARRIGASQQSLGARAARQWQALAEMQG